MERVGKESRIKRAVAVIECYEEIPCNPCVSSCPQKAITMEGGIHCIPHLDESKCIGCGICITRCSGQAIFVVENCGMVGRVSIPYEFLPLPEKGMGVLATDRNGDVVCDGRIVSVRSQKGFDHTNIVTLEVPREFLEQVRGFRYRQEDGYEG